VLDTMLHTEARALKPEVCREQGGYFVGFIPGVKKRRRKGHAATEPAAQAAPAVDKVHRDLILGHSLQGMDAHCMAPSEEDLHRAMARYTEWLDSQLAQKDTDQTVDQTSTPGGLGN